MKSLDNVVSWSRAWLDSLLGDGSVSLTDTSGASWVTWLHSEWTDEKWTDLSGRVADLKAAYKQLARHPAHRCLSFIAVKNKSCQWEFFEALSLMFGESAAVYAFLRFSRALAAIATKLFKLICVEFFDDFTQIEPTCTGDSAEVTFEAMANLLGWQVSAGDKKKPLEKSFVSLGVLVALPEPGD